LKEDYLLLNRRTFLTYLGGAVSLPIVSKFDWLLNERASPLTGGAKLKLGAPPSDVATLLFNVRNLISDPSRWCQGTHWTEGRFCVLGAILAERFRCEINAHRPDVNRNDVEFLNEFQSNLDEHLWKDSFDDYAPLRDDLVHTARWVLNTVVRHEHGNRGAVESWNDFPSTTHGDVLGVLDQAITFELSDAYAAEVILQTNPDVSGLYEDTAIDFSPSSLEPDSLIEKTCCRVFNLSSSPLPEAWRSI
jgi:hypothetical protein